jgi:uncharacterized RDD family membrane protein YckC
MGDEGMTSAGIVIPEAVVLAFDTAGVGSRVLAAVIDLAVVLAGFLGLLSASVILGSTPFGYAGVFVAIFVATIGYPVAFETLLRGRTIGKMAMGLRVVTVEGAPERFRHALIRASLGLVELWATSGAVGILAVLGTPRNQRLGDLAAGTLVLRERTGARQPAPALFMIPPGWEGYAATLDVSGLSSRDYEAARAFLLRAASLDPATRDRLAREIATPLLPRLRHQPPPGVPAEALLVCVAALYQQRQRRAGPWPGVPPSPGPVDSAAPVPGAAPLADAGPEPARAELRPGEPTRQGVVTSAPLGRVPAPGIPPPDTGGFVAPE